MRRAAGALGLLTGAVLAASMSVASAPAQGASTAASARATVPMYTPHRDGPPAGHSGGAGQPTCAACHIGADVNAPGGSLRILGLPAEVERGSELALTVVLESSEMGAAGFQILAWGEAAQAGHPAGRFLPLDARVAVRDSAGLSYAQHTRLGSTPSDPSRASWSLSWSAPDTPGQVTLSVAANSANGDDSPLGDLIYTAEAGTRVR